MTTESLSLTRSRLELPAIIATVCGFAFSAGLLYPAVALALAGRGVGEDLVGLNTAMVGAGVIASALVLPRLTTRYGGWPMLYVAAAGAIVTLGGMIAHYDFWLWCALRFLLGVFINGLYVIGEAWINAIAREETRGRTIALYTTVMGAAFAAGPALVPVIGHQGAAPFLVTAGVIALSVLPMAGFRRVDPLIGDRTLAGAKEAALAPVMRRGAMMMAAVFCFGVMDGATLGLMPVYALGHGLAEADAALPLTVLVVGAVGLQYPVGWLCDRLGPRQVLTGCAAVTALSGGLLPLTAPGSFPFYALLVPWGGACFALFTVSLMLAGRRFRGPELAAASAGLTMMWGIGATLGPWAIGAAMAETGPDALPLGLTLVFIGLTAASLIFRHTLPTRAEAAGTTEG